MDGLTLQERAALLGREADRIQCQMENGLPKEQGEQALKALAMRMKLLELEGKLAGVFGGGRATERALAKELAAGGSLLEDPAEEAARAKREYEEVVGSEK